MAYVQRNGGARGKRAPLPSAQEQMNKIGRKTFGDEFSGMPTAATAAEFKALQKIYKDSSRSLDYFMYDEDRPGYNNLAGLPSSMDTAPGRQFVEFDPLSGAESVPGYFGPQADEDDSPAPLTVVPTSTTDYERPRTVAAGYDADEEKLTVVFRDGTFYNYYEVTESEWEAFKANRSKGAIIYRMLDFKPRGPADDSSVSQEARAAYYRYARAAQVHVKGKPKKQTKTTYKTIAQKEAAKRTARSKKG